MQQRLTEAEQLADEMIKECFRSHRGLAAQEPSGRWCKTRLDEARAALEMAVPNSQRSGGIGETKPVPLQPRHRRRGRARAAVLIARDPAHAESHHNLGTLLMRCRRHDEAVAAYRQSLRYRPNYVPTYQGLGYALKESGRLAEAASSGSKRPAWLPTRQYAASSWHALHMNS